MRKHIEELKINIENGKAINSSGKTINFESIEKLHNGKLKTGTITINDNKAIIVFELEEKPQGM